jgi:hypothetical protein
VAIVAQLVEHGSYEPKVEGSKPSSRIVVVFLLLPWRSCLFLRRFFFERGNMKKSLAHALLPKFKFCHNIEMDGKYLMATMVTTIILILYVTGMFSVGSMTVEERLVYNLTMTYLLTFLLPVVLAIEGIAFYMTT